MNVYFSCQMRGLLIRFKMALGEYGYNHGLNFLYFLGEKVAKERLERFVEAGISPKNLLNEVLFPLVQEHNLTSTEYNSICWKFLDEYEQRLIQLGVIIPNPEFKKN